MRKPRPAQGLDAVLTEQQRANLDALLFEQSKTYAEAVQILREVFGIETSESALGTYYKKRGRERLQTQIATAAEASTVRASGVEVTIVCKEPGVIRLAIRPLNDDSATE